MLKRIEYKTQKEGNNLIAEQAAKGLRICEEQLHNDGKFLIFTDEPYIPTPLPRDLAAEIDKIKLRLNGMKV